MAGNIDEGSIYVMSNFYTKEATGSLKPVSSKILINFSPSTTVQKLTEDDFMIPLHKFEFVDLGDLFSIASKCPNDEYPEYSTVIIGVVEDFEHVSSIKTKFGQMNIVKFRITDGRNSHKVTIWGDLAVKAKNDYNKTVETPVIAIVTSTRLKTYKKKRYRIAILAEDSSEAYNFILMDSATRHLTSMTATKMQSEMLKAS
ncbi:hypothetical protein POM88_015789 [Heracleum sosnowskyi]|uniref:Replication protein A OB domain-containing protein n=1 Tax=Heracleum sosnowskyi TaxID=360622 RepID=A0AAD8IML5_9APIA|nr:hypothetical protein POM88_015789 [Heracleum sosnowskyi]